MSKICIVILSFHDGSTILTLFMNTRESSPASEPSLPRRGFLWGSIVTLTGLAIGKVALSSLERTPEQKQIIIKLARKELGDGLQITDEEALRLYSEAEMLAKEKLSETCKQKGDPFLLFDRPRALEGQVDNEFRHLLHTFRESKARVTKSAADAGEAVYDVLGEQ